LVAAVGPTTGDHLHQLSNGCDPRPVVPDSSAKSISVEETYESDLVGVEVMETALLNLAERLSGRLRRAGLRARTITLKLRYEDFTRLSRSVTVPGGTNGSRQLFLIAVELLSALGVKRPVRLLGLGGGSFEDAEGPQQMDLESRRGWDRVEEAVAEVRDRFGDGAVTPARLARRREAGRDKDVPS
jgi:DNA polymerase-4